MNSAIASKWGTAPNTFAIGYSCGDGQGIDLICAQNAFEELVNGGEAKVINMSFAYNGPIPQSIIDQWQSIAQLAQSKGVLVLASAGNSSTSGFPANITGILSVGRVDNDNQAIGASDVDLRAPQSGTIKHLSCSCEAAVSGVSYSTAWASGLAARLLAEGKDYQATKNILTANSQKSVRHPFVPKPVVVSNGNRLLSNGRAVHHRGRIVITYKSQIRAVYRVRANKRVIRTTKTRLVVRTKRASKFVYVTAGRQTMRIRVIKR